MSEFVAMVEYALKLIKWMALTAMFVAPITYFVYTRYLRPKTLKYKAGIWERGAFDKSPQRVGEDTLIGKKESFLGGNYIWRLSKAKEIVPEPHSNCIQHGKFVDFLKISNTYIPMTVNVSSPDINLEPMSYDLDMARITQSEIRKKQYENKNKWDEMKPMVYLGGIALVFILTVYLTTGYSSDVISSATDKAMSRVDTTAKILEKMYDKMGITAATPGPGGEPAPP